MGLGLGGGARAADAPPKSATVQPIQYIDFVRNPYWPSINR